MMMLLILITLLNGTPFLAARIGWLNPVAYQRDYEVHCLDQEAPVGLVSACPAIIADPAQQGKLKRLAFKKLHEVDSYWSMLKLPRLLLLLSLPLLTLFESGIPRRRWPTFRRLPCLPFAGKRDVFHVDHSHQHFLWNCFPGEPGAFALAAPSVGCRTVRFPLLSAAMR